jgi:hypothetical protein
MSGSFDRRVAGGAARVDARAGPFVEVQDAAQTGQIAQTAHAAQAAQAAQAPGRACPLHYRYRPEVFAAQAPATLSGLDVLYVVGGLYGNTSALDRVLELFERESGRKHLIFNGDFHWFDADPAEFERVQRLVLAHTALRGNVETELAADPGSGDADAGCGCAYPDWVGDGVVERSNRILARLRRAADPAQRAALADLPMWLRADVGDVRLGLVHGDAQSLAGWGFAQEHLRDAAHRDLVRDWLHRAHVDAFACTHTCLPVYQGLRARVGGRRQWVLNNGATGMPNFAGDSAGLLTRIAVTPCDAHLRRFGVRVGAVHADAIAVVPDTEAWRHRFLRQWAAGTDAHASYFDRIVQGPSYALEEAVRVEE